MKLRIYKNWILNRTLIFAVVIISIIFGIYTIALLSGTFLIRSLGHEFSHAAIVTITGGNTEIISLGPGNSQFIDFSASKKALPFVYMAGMIFDTFMVLIAANILFTSESMGIFSDNILKLFAVIIIYLMVHSHLLIENSDFNNTLRSFSLEKWT